MQTKITNIILLTLVVVSFVAGLVVYQYLPDRVASHWNSAGEVNGYMNKFWGIFLTPFILIGMFLLYFIIPKIDPLKSNLESFKKYYNIFWLFFFLFLIYIFILQISWNFGLRFNFTMAIVPALAALWYFLGAIIQKAKRNWFFGIRTPWTLSNDIVWDKTHKLGGKLFQIAAIISLLAIFFSGDFFVFIIIVPLILVSIVTMIYSYLEFRKIKNQNN
jgi:uncharacterized membrane protein